MKEIIVQVPDDCEIQIVKKENKKLIIKTYQDLINNQVECGGYYINTFSTIKEFSVRKFANNVNRNLATTKKIAKSMLAMAMISQLIRYYGGAITDKEWNNRSIIKYSIERFENKIIFEVYKSSFHFLSFHTKEQRNEFIKYNEQLIKDYLMID